MDRKHELICAVKEIASLLGRTPGKRDFIEHKGSMHKVLSSFGSYSIFLQAAGLDPAPIGPKKKFTSEAIYGRDIEQVIESHVPKIVDSSSKDFEPILAIGDTHFPFVHKPTLDKIYRFAEKEQPKFIVQIGDLNDQFSHSRFPKSLNIYKPDEEMELARRQSIEMWVELRRACPKSQCFQIMGNHDLRALKLILQSAPTLESLLSQSINKLYEFEGVKTIHDYREELIIQGIMFHHGYMSQLGQQRDFVQQNVVHGHTHKGGVTYRPLKGRTLWELDCGFVGDAESKALGYTPQKTTAWTLGLGGWIDEYGPRFIPA